MGLIPGRMWNYELPEIYQIEVSSVCNLKCQFCIRDKVKLDRGSTFIDTKLVKKIIKSGALKNTGFVELQMAGEPLLHPKIEEIIELLQKEVKVGLSTNGLLFRDRMQVLAKLNFLTVSVDSVSSREKVRAQDFEEIRACLSNLFAHTRYPKVDLQIIEIGDWKYEFALLQNIAEVEKWPVVVRSVPDCFVAHFKPEAIKEVPEDLCINPWFSVSIHCDGDVTPCCFSFGKELVLGNLNEDSLSDIWKGKKAEKLRDSFKTGKYMEQCKRCYMRSPALLHYQFLKAWA